MSVEFNGWLLFFELFAGERFTVPFLLNVGSLLVNDEGLGIWFLKGGDLCGIMCMCQVASLVLFSSAA